MDTQREIVCPKCGEKLPKDSVFCVKCGAKIEEVQKDLTTDSTKESFVRKNRKSIIVCIGVVLIIALIGFIINAVQASSLKKELMRDWEDIEGDNGSYILCILDFSDDEIEYKLETGYAFLNTTVATYKYKVVSGNKIKVNRFGDEWETFTVEFTDDKARMTVSPALTSVDNKEHWYNFD